MVADEWVAVVTYECVAATVWVCPCVVAGSTTTGATSSAPGRTACDGVTTGDAGGSSGVAVAA